MFQIKMAQFCKNCLKKVMGLDNKKYPEWFVNKGDICEGCGYKYLKELK